MNLTLAYRGHSDLVDAGGRQTLSLAPNLAREPVAFDAALLEPLRFRDAISALHDVVISDLRFKKRDKTAYLDWKKQQAAEDEALRRAAYKVAREQVLAAQGNAVPRDLEKTYARSRKRYWAARQQYSNYLLKHDRDLWRKLMPCDPVITVADDVCLFECFSGDESSYGCLTVERAAAFGKPERLQLGTTNVDYSWDLFNHFQALRSYRDTRFRVDPEGFELQTSGPVERDRYREEKIDLPQGWLRGFMQIQVAMGLPATRVTLSREAVYSTLAFLRRHKPTTSPRALRFELLPDRPPRLVLEPWGQAIDAYGSPVYRGPNVEPIRIWGTRRLLSLARVLSLAESFDVYLLGTGLPSFWVARMGSMRLTLGLSGWTANDWTRASALEMIAPPAAASPDLIRSTAATLQSLRAATLAQVQAHTHGEAAQAAAALRHLAASGQVIYDLTAGVYRWRQIMPQALGEAEIGPEHEEMTGLRLILARRQVKIESAEGAPSGGRAISGKAEGTPVEVLTDGDGRIRRGKCVCGHYRKTGLRNGPCRHMMALRYVDGQRAGTAPPLPPPPLPSTTPQCGEAGQFDGNATWN